MIALVSVWLQEIPGSGLEVSQMEIRPYEEWDGEGVVALWRTCGLVMPWNDPFKDIERKLQLGLWCSI